LSRAISPQGLDIKLCSAKSRLLAHKATN
jgi:hypothetical protein